jgi:hypothetical protein
MKKTLIIIGYNGIISKEINDKTHAISKLEFMHERLSLEAELEKIEIGKIGESLTYYHDLPKKIHPKHQKNNKHFKNASKKYKNH